MKIKNTVMILAGAAILTFAPRVDFPAFDIDGFGLAVAEAKGGGGGNSGGGGGGKGGGGGGSKSESSSGKGGGNSGGNSGGGKSASAKSDTKGGGAKSAKSTTKTSNGKAKAEKAAKVNAEKVAKVKAEKVKLGGLNSLKRNVNAYLNAKDPRMVAVRQYILASLAEEQLDEAVQEAQDRYEEAAKEYADSLLGTPYAGMTPEELEQELNKINEQLAELEEVTEPPEELEEPEDVATLEEPAETPEAPTAEDLEAAKLEIQAILDSTAAKALAEANQQLEDAKELADATELTEADLIAALGTDDQATLDWARSVLGVGTADGKIDEIREILADSET